MPAAVPARAAAPVAEKVSAGIAFKNAGNDAFRTGDYTEALRQYHHAVLVRRAVVGSDSAAPCGARSLGDRGDARDE